MSRYLDPKADVAKYITGIELNIDGGILAGAAAPLK